MTELAAVASRRVGPSEAVPNDFVVPYYLDDRKLRISIARVATQALTVYDVEETGGSIHIRAGHGRRNGDV